jgi:hypothetical protein
MNSSRSIFLGLDLNIVINQEPLTTLRNRSSQKNGDVNIVDLSCNAEVRFPVLIAMAVALKVFTRGTLTFFEIAIVVLFIVSLAAMAALGCIGVRKRNRPSDVSCVLFDQLNSDTQRGLIAR